MMVKLRIKLGASVYLLQKGIVSFWVAKMQQHLKRQIHHKLQCACISIYVLIPAILHKIASEPLRLIFFVLTENFISTC